MKALLFLFTCLNPTKRNCRTRNSRRQPFVVILANCTKGNGGCTRTYGPGMQHARSRPSTTRVLEVSIEIDRSIGVVAARRRRRMKQFSRDMCLCTKHASYFTTVKPMVKHKIPIVDLFPYMYFTQITKALAANAFGRLPLG